MPLNKRINRAMKVLGAIKTIANNQLALQQHFLIIPEMNNTIDEFCEIFDIQNEGMNFLSKKLQETF